MRNIYFCGSVGGGREDAEFYFHLIEYLKQYGNVLNPHIGDSNLPPLELGELSASQIHDRNLNWLFQSQVIVAEVTKPSLGVGYEIGRVVQLNQTLMLAERKPLLCLHRKKDRSLSAMISGCPEISVQLYHNLDEAEREVDRFFNRII